MCRVREGHSYRGPLRAVIFDWAGTVLDYGSRAPVRAVMRTFGDHGVPVTSDEARGPMGMAKRDHIAALLEAPRIRELGDSSTATRLALTRLTSCTPRFSSRNRACSSTMLN